MSDWIKKKSNTDDESNKWIQKKKKESKYITKKSNTDDESPSWITKKDKGEKTSDAGFKHGGHVKLAKKGRGRAYGKNS
jgi:replication initiation and membrane attachment protein DnaB